MSVNGVFKFVTSRSCKFNTGAIAFKLVEKSQILLLRARVKVRFKVSAEKLSSALQLTISVSHSTVYTVLQHTAQCLDLSVRIWVICNDIIFPATAPGK